MSKLSGIGGRLYRGETSIDFIGKRRRWYAVSALFILLSIAALTLQVCIWVLSSRAVLPSP
jgi:preprotein translocase subunit SecF